MQTRMQNRLRWLLTRPPERINILRSNCDVGVKSAFTRKIEKQKNVYTENHGKLTDKYRIVMCGDATH